MKADNSWATVNVVKFPSGTPVAVCQPSDTNSNCGGSSSGGSGNVGIGTANYIPEYIGVGTLGPSNIVAVNGNVGIGSTNPGQALDVNGTIRANGNLIVGSTGKLTIDSSGNVNSSGNISVGSSTFNSSGIFLSGSGLLGVASVSGGGSTLDLKTNFGGTDTVTINNANVGIGSVNPGQALDVQGTVRSIGSIINAIGTATPGCDANTALLIHPGGSLADVSGACNGGSNVTVTNSGTTINSSIYKYSQYPQSVAFNGSSYFSVPTGIGATGTNNFYYQAWIYNTSQSATNTIMAQSTSSPNGNFEWVFNVQTTGALFYQYYNNTNSITITSSAGAIPLNTWTLVAVSRSGNTFNLYINGTVVATGTYSGSVGFSGPLTYGVSLGDSGRYFTGYMDDMLFYNSALQTTNYTPASTPVGYITSTQTLTFQNAGSTLSQIQSNSANNSLSFINNGNTALTINSSGALVAGSAGITLGGVNNTTWPSGTNYWLQGQGNVGVGTYNNVGIGTIVTSNAQLTIGIPAFSNTGTLAQLTSNTAGYNQIIVQNTSNTTNASTNYIVGNNNGTASTYYGEFGMNSSTFTGSGAWSLPNAVYLDASTADLSLGTLGNYPIHFFTNSGTTDAMEIVGQNVGIGSTVPGQKLDVVGTIRALSSGSCTTLYRCVGGVDAGVIQTSACTLCAASTCTAMNGCF